MTDRRGWILGLLASPLTGCAAIDLATRQPPQLYALTPKSTFTEGVARTSGTLMVETPTATAGLNTRRIALRPDPTRIDYYADATWIEVLPLMVQNLITESIDNAGGIDALGVASAGVRADWALVTHIREFQAEYADLARAPTVRVVLEARILRLPRRTQLARTSIAATADAASTALPTVVQAFDDALGKVLKRLTIWVEEQVAKAESVKSS
ncbi:MAG: ABC-type transport auxiliary lipoprotein family protein [Geminicoccaceae bacterium]